MKEEATYNMAKGASEWQRLMKDLQPPPPEPPPEPLNQQQLDYLLDQINDHYGTLKVVELAWGDLPLTVINVGCQHLASKNLVHCVNKVSGRYVNLKTWDSWNKQRRFEESVQL